MASDNYIDYPSMTRTREDSMQQGLLAKADDINAEFNNVIATYNRLVALLQGEFGGNGRIYELVDTAVANAIRALGLAENSVSKDGGTVTGQLVITQPPTSDYSAVNKKYVDDEISTTVGPVANNVTNIINRLDTLDASQVQLHNGNFVSNNVNDGLNELFQSVSNGKQTIADAITDKGIQTSATDTFATMASHIYDILTFTEGTSGGNITPDTVLKGYIGFSKGAVVVGTHECSGGGGGTDTSDATAVASDILKDKTAYARGIKLTGTHVCQGGTDTSDATATSTDILKGKTAYARGVKLTGALEPVEELYELDPLHGFEEHAITGIDSHIDAGETVKHYAVNKYNNGFLIVTTDGTTDYVYSLGIDSDRIVKITDGSGSAYKYKYSMAELGITYEAYGLSSANRLPISIEYVVAGARGNNRAGYLYIVTNLDLQQEFNTKVDAVLATGLTDYNKATPTDYVARRCNGITVIPYYQSISDGFKLGNKLGDGMLHKHYIVPDRFPMHLNAMTYGLGLLTTEQKYAVLDAARYLESINWHVDFTVSGSAAIDTPYKMTRTSLIPFNTLVNRFIAHIEVSVPSSFQDSTKYPHGHGYGVCRPTSTDLSVEGVLGLIDASASESYTISDLSGCAGIALSQDDKVFVVSNGGGYGSSRMGTLTFKEDGSVFNKQYTSSGIDPRIQGVSDMELAIQSGNLRAISMTDTGELVLGSIKKSGIEMLAYYYSSSGNTNEEFVAINFDKRVLTQAGKSWSMGQEKEVVAYYDINGEEVYTQTTNIRKGTYYVGSEQHSYGTHFIHNVSPIADGYDCIVFLDKGASSGFIHRTIVMSREVYGVKYNNEVFIKQGILNLTATDSDVAKGKKYIGASGIASTGTRE